MPRFPKDENKIIELAQMVAGGIGGNPATFPNPPVTAAVMNTDLGSYVNAMQAAQSSKADWMQKTQEKNEILDRLTDAARGNIDYGIIIANGNNMILEEIGWSNRAAPTALQLPGQCRVFEIIGQGDAFVRFDWKEPADGGKVAAYKVQRSEDGSNFIDAATSVESEAALFNQPVNKKLIYRVVAINRAGEGMPSNSVSLTL